MSAMLMILVFIPKATAPHARPATKCFSSLKDKLKLPINREKSGIRKPVQFEILGYKFVPTYEKGTRGKYQLVVSEKSWQKLKQSLKFITRKTAPLSLALRIHKLNEVCKDGSITSVWQVW